MRLHVFMNIFLTLKYNMHITTNIYMRYVYTSDNII